MNNADFIITSTYQEIAGRFYSASSLLAIVDFFVTSAFTN
jgi:hypothetical protein